MRPNQEDPDPAMASQERTVDRLDRPADHRDHHTALTTKHQNNFQHRAHDETKVLPALTFVVRDSRLKIILTRTQSSKLCGTVVVPFALATIGISAK
jgi:hypothetical protein